MFVLLLLLLLQPGLQEANTRPHSGTFTGRLSKVHTTEELTMAMSRDLGDTELQSFTSSRGIKGHHVPGRLLSLKEVYDILTKNTALNISRFKMLKKLNNVDAHNFNLIQPDFSVSYLQHVTDKAAMEQIIEMEGFVNKPSEPSRHTFSDLSFWSAGIASKDVEATRESSFEVLRGMLPLSLDSKNKRKFKEQFANSPAFNPSASRYGNFKFSFTLFSLLDLYQAQHCGGEEPQLRILGTDMYRQELVHYILVHSPDERDQFENLLMVPTIDESSNCHNFVYKKNGILYWRPESTSSEMRVMYTKKGISPKKCPQPCDYFNENDYCFHIKEDEYEVWTVWNHLVLAFHLPNNRRLKIPEGQLLKNLTACNIENRRLVEASKRLLKEEAERVIQQKKRDFRRGNRAKRSSVKVKQSVRKK